MFTLTSQDRHGVAVEPIGILRNVRTEYGKEIRKDYESGKLDISRHEFLANEIREDEIANTLDTSCNQGIFVQISEELTVYAVWYEKYQ